MSRLLLRRKSSIKSTIKPIPIVKEPKKESSVEFRWSTTAAQYGVSDITSLLNFNLINLDSSQEKVFFSSPISTTRNSVDKFSTSSPRLPNINTINKNKELSISTDENNHNHINPISLSYSQLHQTQNSSYKKKKSQTQYSLYPLMTDKGSRISIANTDLSISSNSTSTSSVSIDQRKLSNDKYIRLHTSQLRRLNVSNKYLKEAKKLYFNATSKVFVPRHSIVQIS